MPRHKWGEPLRFRLKTERQCEHCDIVKVTRHEPGERPWVEFYRGLDRIITDNNRTPACVAVAQSEAA
jgi:hypothetical protein